MSTAVIDVSQEKEVVKTEIPKYLIYEMYMGKPIYYRGYEEVLAGTKTLEQIMGDSTLQSWLKIRLGIVLSQHLESLGYEVFGGELGITFKKEGWRSADLAIYKYGMELTVKYAKISPQVAIEIDVQADTKSLGGEMKYVEEKTNQYLKHGTKKVIWIFTNAGAIMEATEQNNFQINSWDKDLEIMEGVSINIAQMIENRRKPTV